MPCFTVWKTKKKRPDQPVYVKPVNTKEEHLPAILPEPQLETRSLQSAPPSFRTRVKPIQPVNNKVSSNRARALSAPSYLDAAEQDALGAIDYDAHDEPKLYIGLNKEQKSSGPQPLPLPSPQATASLKISGSFKSVTSSSSGSLYSSGPLPLPPTGSLRNFSFEEVSAACHHFSSDRCMSEGLSSFIYKASFGDDSSSLRKFEATVSRLYSSNQVLQLVTLFGWTRYSQLCCFWDYIINKLFA